MWGDILSTVGVFSTVGDIMGTAEVILSTVRDIMMHLGDVQHRDNFDCIYHPLLLSIQIQLMIKSLNGKSEIVPLIVR